MIVIKSNYLNVLKVAATDMWYLYYIQVVSSRGV